MSFKKIFLILFIFVILGLIFLLAFFFKKNNDYNQQQKRVENAFASFPEAGYFTISSCNLYGSAANKIVITIQDFVQGAKNILQANKNQINTASFSKNKQKIKDYLNRAQDLAPKSKCSLKIEEVKKSLDIIN